MWIIREDSPHLFLLHISLSRSRPKGVKGQRHEYPRVKGIARYLRLFMSRRIAHIFYGFYIASLSGNYDTSNLYRDKNRLYNDSV